MITKKKQKKNKRTTKKYSKNMLEVISNLCVD